MQKFRFHVVSLPHTMTLKNEFSWCAFTEKVRKFCDMMMSLGHEVILYAGEENDARCTELVTCISKAEQEDLFPEMVPEFSEQHPGFRLFNDNIIKALATRKEPRDFLCLIGGAAQFSIAAANPEMQAVEFGVGYPGVFAKFRVFESYAWMHTIYGQMVDNAAQCDGQFFDTVIPNYWDPAEFPAGRGDGDYLLFMGRLVNRKGVHIAANAAKLTGQRLIIAGGMGDAQTKYGEYVGVVGPERRAELMGGATAILAPTIYVEPFGGVAVEAQLCGTPAITTDWGAYTETVEQGVTGYRCRTLGEFVAAVERAPSLDRTYIRQRAQHLWSMDVVKLQYQHYFERLYLLWEEGFYSKKPQLPGK